MYCKWIWDQHPEAPLKQFYLDTEHRPVILAKFFCSAWIVPDMTGISTFCQHRVWYLLEREQKQLLMEEKHLRNWVTYVMTLELIIYHLIFVFFDYTACYWNVTQVCVRKRGMRNAWRIIVQFQRHSKHVISICVVTLSGGPIFESWNHWKHEGWFAKNFFCFPFFPMKTNFHMYTLM